MNIARALAVLLISLTLIPAVAQTPDTTTPAATEAILPADITHPPEAEAEALPAREKFGFAVFSYYLWSRVLGATGDAPLSPGVSQDFDVIENLRSGWGLGLEARLRGRDRVWITIGLMHDFEREFRSVEVESAGRREERDYLSPRPSLRLTTAFANVSYEVTPKFYLLGGLNISQFDLDNADFDLDPATGLQVGFGFNVFDPIHFELMYRFAAATGEKTTTFNGQTVRIDYDSAGLGGALFILKAVF